MKQFPPFQLDSVNQCLWHHRHAGNDERILLTPKAFAVLRYLVERAGRLVTQDELLEAIWPNIYVQPEVLKYQIADVRSALGDSAKNPLYIETLPRRGYRFVASVTEAEPGIVPLSAEAPPRELVGRDAPLNELLSGLKRMLQGERQLVFITGEPGIGKTALVDEFQRRAAEEVTRISIARGQCVEGYGGKEPYFPMLEALAQLCGTSAENFTFRTLVERAPTWAVQFPALLIPDDRQKLQHEIFGTTSRRMLREICEALEVITAQFPLLLVFEDLQWVDHSTIDLISALARGRTRARLMLIAAYRPANTESAGSPLRTLKQELVGHGLSREISLQPLSEADVAKYLAAGSRDTTPPNGLAALIYRRSEGNPLFMVATLEDLNQRRLFRWEQGIWQVKVPPEETDMGIPDTLRGLIETWIERLPAREQSLLEAASVTGAYFSSSISAAATTVSAETFDEICEDLARRMQFVRPAGLEDLPDGSVSQRYEFVHAIFRDVFYYRQTPGRRARSHKRIGERLETLFQTRLSELAAKLADHFEKAADWPRAIKYFRQVAATASRRHAPREATDILRHAYDLCARLPDSERAACETGILEKLVSMYVVSFDTRVLQVSKTLWRRAAHYGMLDMEVRALINVAYPMSWISTKRSLVVLDRALQVATSSPDPLFRARTRASCLVRRIWASGWDSRDAQDCLEAVEEIRQAGDAVVLAWHLVDCNFVRWCASEYRDAHRSAVENLSVLLRGEEQNPYPSFIYWLSQFVLPWSLLFLGEWGAALKEIEDGIRMVEKNGDYYRAQTLRLYQAWIRLEAMDFAGVLNICQSLLPALGSSARTPWRRFCTILAASADAEMGKFERALDRFAAVRAEMNRQTVIHDWYCRMLLQAGLTELWIARGDLPQARQNGQIFLEVTLATAERTWQARAWEINARIAMAERDLTRAEMCISRALGAMEGFETPLAAWQVHATAADIHECLMNSDGASYHREASHSIIMKLAKSLDADENLRNMFLSAPTVSRVLQRHMQSQSTGERRSWVAKSTAT